MTLRGTSTANSSVDIQVEWRTQSAIRNGSSWTPQPTYLTTLLGAVSGTDQVVEPPADLTYTTWWYRARAGNSSTSVWGDWSAERFLDVYPILGSVAEYVEINIGIENVPTLNALAYLEMNIGVSDASVFSLVKYLQLNVGVMSGSKLAAEYTNLNVYPPTGRYKAAAYTDLFTVSNETPIPHIWWIRPEQGREGYVFNIYGHGFGSAVTAFNGRVKLGNLVCAIARWEVVPPKLVASTVRVTGTPRAASSVDLPYVLLNSGSLVLSAGDIIEYDVLWEVPTGSRLDIFPTFMVDGTVVGTGAALLADTTAKQWASDIPEAYGAWLHRRFVIPPGHFLVGKTASNFGIAWYGFDATSPVRTASVRSFVIRDSEEVAKRWITGDDNNSAPPLTYVANTASLVSSEFDQDGYEIHHGQALDPDRITTEHGWIVAVVPPGAVSSAVNVVLGSA